VGDGNEKGEDGERGKKEKRKKRESVRVGEKLSPNAEGG